MLLHSIPLAAPAMDSTCAFGGTHLAVDAPLLWDIAQEGSRRRPFSLQNARYQTRRRATVAQTHGRDLQRKFSQYRFLTSPCRIRWTDSLPAIGRRFYAIGGESEGDAAGYEERDNSWHSLPPATEEVLQYLGYDGSSPAQSNKGFESVAQRNFATVAEREIGTEGLGLPQQGYIGLFVRRLGLDNRAEDREEAVKALWRHSMGGKQCVDQIVEFPGTLTLIVSLLPSDRPASAEAAAGLLRNISAFNAHRAAVAEAGAVEEITGILTRRSITSEVKEQATFCLWNLSVEEKLRTKIRIFELVPVLVGMLDSEELDREAAAGVLAKLALSECNHGILIESGIIPKLTKLLRDGKGSKVTRQEARNALLELAKDNHHRLAIIEEGLVLVPLIGAGAYQSFKPLLDVAPTLPEDVKIKQSPSLPSTFGAGELLLGLNIGSGGHDIDDATQLAIEGRARQQFLGRIGLLEKETGDKAEQGVQVVKKDEKVTLMPWWDGIPRLVLILGLEDMSAARLAANTISEIAINEEIREAIQKAGSIPHLVRLLGSGDEAATEASASALERLAISYKVRRSIDAHAAVPALVAVLKADDAPESVKEKVVAALARLSQTGEEVKAMIQSGAIPGLIDIVESRSATVAAKEEAEDILEEISTRKVDSRDKIVSANGVPPLVEILASGIPLQKEKAACVLENLAAKEQHAECIVAAGVELALKSVLEVKLGRGENDAMDSQELIRREETWSAVAAASRLLDKLLRFEKVRNSIDCKSLAILLAELLKSDTPLYVKDWVSACLLKLDRLVGVTTNVGIPVDLEITLHDTIPRLIKEIETSSSSSVQEKAVMHLRDLVSLGVVDYVVAIADLGGIFPLVDLLDKGTPGARAAALAVLYNLGMNDENHPAILAAGAVTYLERLVRSGGAQWRLALYLLRALPT